MINENMTESPKEKPEETEITQTTATPTEANNATNDIMSQPILNKRPMHNDETPVTGVIPPQSEPELSGEATKPNSLDDFQKKVELALQQEQTKQNVQIDENEKTPVKKEDPKYDEIKSILGDEIIQNLDSNKWEQKKQGFEDINKFIQNNPASTYKTEDLYAYLKFKLKDFKESNFNLIREAIGIFNTLIEKKLLKRDESSQVLNAYYEKLGDPKLKESVGSFVNNFSDAYGPDTLIKTLITKMSKKANNKVLIEYSTVFGKFVEDYDIDNLPIKEMVDICKIMASNSNPQVRSSATSLLCVLYKYIGNDIKTLIKDIKESTLKIIEAEFEKITVIPRADKKSKKEPPKPAKGSGATPAKNTVSNELIPRVDVSKKITSALLKEIKDGKWLEKKEACEQIEKILSDANMKILPDGLGDLFNLIKGKLSDGNKNLVRMMILLTTKLIESLGGGFKQFSKVIALSLIPTLSDKMQMLRDDAQTCLDAWVNNVGFDTIIYYVPQFMKNNNSDLRTELFKFLNKHKDKFTKQIGETVFKEMVPSILNCMQDKSASLRTSAEETIVFSGQFISINLYYKALKDFKPAIANGLRTSLDKLQSNSEVEETTGINPSASVYFSQKERESSQVFNTQEECKTPTREEKTTRPNHSIKVLKKKRHQLSNDDLIGQKKEPNNLTSHSTVLKSNSKATNSTQLKKVFISRQQIFLSNPTVKPNKEKRYENDRRYKFTMEAISSDFSRKLRDQVNTLFTEEFIKKIFSDEFKSLVDALKQLKLTIEKGENIPILLDNLDLLLKILGVKCGNNQNPTMMKTLFEFLDTLATAVVENSYTLNDTEVNIVIYLLIEKLGMTNKSLKEQLVQLIHEYFELIGANKATLIALNFSLNKNAKIKSEILDITTDLYLNGVVDVVGPKFAKIFSKFLSVNDNNIKGKVISLFKELYSKIGDELWNYIDVNEKEKEILESNLYDPEQEDDEEEEEEYQDDNQYDSEEEQQKSPIVKKKSHSELRPEHVSSTGALNAQGYSSSNESSEHHKIIVKKNKTPRKSTHDDTSNQIIFNTNGSLKDKDELYQTLENLLTNDPNERVNTIIIIHELICAKFEENRMILIENIDFIIKIFVQAMKNLFSVHDITTIPIKFAKYLATVLCKIASNKDLICNISYEVLYVLSEELLSNLLIEGLDKIGTNQEGSIIFKSLNSTMLRVLENCNSTFVILALLELIRVYRTNEEKNKLAGLAIKCLLKVNQNFEKIISTIEIDKVLLQIHLLLIDFDKTNPDLTPKTQTDQVVIKYIKNLINEMVKIKRNEIITDYSKGVRHHSVPDKYIFRWIKNCLSIFQSENSSMGLNVSCVNENNISGALEKISGSKPEDKSRSIRTSSVEKPQKPAPSHRPTSTHDFNSTISKLKNKWNDVNKKRAGLKKK